MPKITVLPMGDDGFLAFTPETLDHLKVQIGDEIFVTETDNGLQITRHDPEAKGPPSGKP